MYFFDICICNLLKCKSKKVQIEQGESSEGLVKEGKHSFSVGEKIQVSCAVGLLRVGSVNGWWEERSRNYGSTEEIPGK